MENSKKIKNYKKIQNKKYKLKRFNKEAKIEKENKKAEIITEKMRDLEEKISDLEYQKEAYIQQLSILQNEENKCVEEFKKAKESNDVDNILEASEKIKSVRDKMKPLDIKLQLINARITINMLRLTRYRESYIKRTSNINRINGYIPEAIDKAADMQRRIFKHNDKNRIAKEQQNYREYSDADYFEGNYNEEDEKITPLRLKTESKSILISNTDNSVENSTPVSTNNNENINGSNVTVPITEKSEATNKSDEVEQVYDDGPIKIGEDEEVLTNDQRKEIELQSKNRIKNRILKSLPGRIFYVYPKALGIALKEKMGKSQKINSIKNGSKRLIDNFIQAKNELLEDIAQKASIKALPEGKIKNEEKEEKHTEERKIKTEPKLEYDEIIEIGKYELGVEQQEPTFLKKVKLKNDYINLPKAMHDAKNKADNISQEEQEK